MNFTPIKRWGGGTKSVSHAERGAQTVLGSFNTGAWSLSHTDGGGGAQKVPIL